jgi:hypothetical protein
MPKANIIQTNFSSGEISPLAKGRVDIVRFFNGAERLENFMVYPQGGIGRRRGSKFISEVKDSAQYTVLQQFKFSSGQSYILEFGDQYIRIFQGGGVVESAPAVPVEVVSPWTTSQLNDLYFTQSADVMYICHPDHQTRTLSRTSHTSWSLSLFTTLDGPYMPQNTTDPDLADVELTTTGILDRAFITSTANDFVVGDVGKYVEYYVDDLRTLAKITNYISATKVEVEPKQNVLAPLPVEASWETVTSTGTWTCTLEVSHGVFSRNSVGMFVYADFGIGHADTGWYLIYQYDGASRDKVQALKKASYVLVVPTGTLTLSGRTVYGEVYSSADLFVASDIDRHIRLNVLTEQIPGTIISYHSARHVTVKFTRAFPLKEDNPTKLRNDGKTKEWRLGAWSASTGWPSCVVFHEERLVFAATNSQPLTVWMSYSGDYINFAPTEDDSIVTDANAVTYTIASDEVNRIRWLVSSTVLLIGTTGSEYQTRASSSAEPITPTNIQVLQQTKFGSNKAKPQKVANSVLYIQRSGRKLRELIYSYEVDGFVSNDLTIVSEHVLRENNQAVDTVYQPEPHNLVWIVTESGQLLSFVFNKEQEIFSWGRHVLGGSYNGGSPVVESVAVSDSTSGLFDEVWLIVKRTINGQTKRYIEYITGEFWPTSPTDKTDMYFVDCGLTYSGALANQITGLDHLEGQTVQICGNGAIQPTRVVNGGAIQLQEPVTHAHVGLGYTSIVKTMPLEGGSEYGTSQGKKKRLQRLVVRLLNSMDFKFGDDLSRLDEESVRDTSHPMNQSPPLFTGDRDLRVDISYDLQSQYYVVQDKPYPLTIIALMPEVSTYE